MTRADWQTVRAHIHAICTLIEYRERAGPRVYIAKDLDAALRALLVYLETGGGTNGGTVGR
jgi:hypothetical protein